MQVFSDSNHPHFSDEDQVRVIAFERLEAAHIHSGVIRPRSFLADIFHQGAEQFACNHRSSVL
jgi:hypothetical protein